VWGWCVHGAGVGLVCGVCRADIWNEPNETAPVVAGVWVVNLVNILSVCIQAKTKLFHAN
jgi:hypothetical protein